SRVGEVRLEPNGAPRYNKPRIMAIQCAEVELGIRRLSESDSLKCIEAIPVAMRQWLSALPSLVDRTAGLSPLDKEAIDREEQQFAEDQKKWRAEADAIEAGIAILRVSK